MVNITAALIEWSICRLFPKAGRQRNCTLEWLGIEEETGGEVYRNVVTVDMPGKNGSWLMDRSMTDPDSSAWNVVFWGAQTYMPTNVAHVILCAIVVATYVFVPDLGKSLYDRAILRHNICLLAQGVILSFLGFCHLCKCPRVDNLTIAMWLLLQYFTIAMVFWLNVICFDMTLAITSFRWTMGTGQRTEKEERRRSLMYGAFVWIGSSLPTLTAAFFEYCPNIDPKSPLKPNYTRYEMGPNPTVNLYFFAVPLFTLFWNNVLFVFTTYKIAKIQRSMEVMMRDRKNHLNKRYFLFLRLYLLMGAPWFFGCLFACLNKLFILKICRLIQPILWLAMLACQKKIRQKFLGKICPSGFCVSRKPDSGDNP